MPTVKKTRSTESRARLLIMLAAGDGRSSRRRADARLGVRRHGRLGDLVHRLHRLGVGLGDDDWTLRATKDRAHREDPTSVISGALTLVASVASIGAVIILIVAGKNAHGIAEVLVPVLAVVSLALSWFLIHTLFTLRYARLYFDDTPGGVDFNQSQTPRYLDFAYLAFTLGMTYQVSDTSLQTSQIRAVALRQALLSYLFGAVILAATINLVAGLAN